MEVPPMLTYANELLENATRDVERWRLVATTAAATLAAVGLADLLSNWGDYSTNAKKEVLRWIKNIPAVKMFIEFEMESLGEKVSGSYFPTTSGVPYVTSLPEKGWTTDEVEAFVQKVVSTDRYDWRLGKISGGTFTGNSTSYTSLMASIFHTTIWTNPLHYDVFPGARKMDAEVIAMTKNLLHADDSFVGCVTCGGSESLMLMMKAYRDYGRQRGIRHPEVVVARTVHAGVDKAAHYLGIKLRKVGLKKISHKADVEQMRRAMNSNTVALVASAPDFSYGIIDDVAAIASLGKSRGVGVHVDCCMGGFILPFMDDAGYPLPPFDFRVPGVTSMSADTHKYGNAPKGSSVLVYREKALLHAQYFKTADWPGGVYATPTVAGSRAGVNVAMCWAALLHHGRRGYVDITRHIITNARMLKDRLNNIHQIGVVGDPVGPIMAVRSNTEQLDILVLGDLMKQRGWHLSPLQLPPGLQVCLTQLHTDPAVVAKMADDFEELVEHMCSTPQRSAKGLSQLYGIADQLSVDVSLVEGAAKIFLDAYYSTPEDQ